jgi:hypothetical protein
MLSGVWTTRIEAVIKTIEQSIEALARERWPEGIRFDIGSTGSHAWHGDVNAHANGFTLLVCNKEGAFVERMVAGTLEELRNQVEAVTRETWSPQEN